jgi:hypothetical protein
VAGRAYLNPHVPLENSLGDSIAGFLTICSIAWALIGLLFICSCILDACVAVADSDGELGCCRASILGVLFASTWAFWIYLFLYSICAATDQPTFMGVLALALLISEPIKACLSACLTFQKQSQGVETRLTLRQKVWNFFMNALIQSLVNYVVGCWLRNGYLISVSSGVDIGTLGAIMGLFNTPTLYLVFSPFLYPGAFIPVV